MLIQTLILFYKYHASKDGHYLFISLAAFQIMAVGALITIGRGDVDAADIGVLFAERFLIYGTVFVVLTYLGLLQLGQQYFSKQTAYLAAPALIWIVVSWNAAIPKLENLHHRLIVDASNALVFNLNTMYEFQDREVNSLKHAGAYHFPNNLLKIQSKDKLTENVVLTPMPNFEKGIKEFEVNGEGTLLVTQNNKAFCFLHINSLSHSVKMKEDLPINIEKSSFSTIR
jgi:DNA integrity scanning protein DisA with diadenylate cyclase activity